MVVRSWAARAAIGAAVALVAAIGCRGQGTTSGGGSLAAPGASARSLDQRKESTPAAARSHAAPQASKRSETKVKAAQAHVERLHTPDGIVTITRTPRATADNLGVRVFPDAREKESVTWRMTPPQGREWVLAIGQFTSPAPIENIEQFYRKALGQPEVRRSEDKTETLVVLSRVTELERAKPQSKEPQATRQSDSIVVRLTHARGSKLTTILIRRALPGAPVRIEPSGELPLKPKPKPKAKVIPVAS